MKVLVIGGAGYIGSHAVYELIRDNNEVVVMDNLSTGDKSFVNKDSKFYLGDTTKKEDLTRIFDEECAIKPFDVVMHFAAKLIVPESMSMPLEYYHNNVEGVRLMLEVMKEHNIKNVVFSSTAAVYGNPEKYICEEEDITLPINPYGASKLASEYMIKWVCNAYNMNYCIFRYFNVAGADKTLEIGLNKDTLTHLIPVTVQTALGIRDKMVVYGNDYDTVDGTCVRDYIHVLDLVNAHMMAISKLENSKGGHFYNVGTGSGFSNKEVIEMIEKVTGEKVTVEISPRREGDSSELVADPIKIKMELGFVPQYSDLETIVKTAWQWHKQS